jgi:hypothetical protein
MNCSASDHHDFCNHTWWAKVRPIVLESVGKSGNLDLARQSVRNPTTMFCHVDLETRIGDCTA